MFELENKLLLQDYQCVDVEIGSNEGDSDNLSELIEEDFPCPQNLAKQSSSWQVADLTNHAPALDGLRGLAILLSIYDHLGHTSGALAGHFGVSIFFVLSGFLISGNLVKYSKQTKPGDFRYHYLGKFYGARIARLLPGQLLLVSLGGLHLKYLSPRKSDNNRIIRGAMRLLTSTEESTQNFRTPFGNTWSLAVEEWSYVILSLLITFLPKRYRLRLSAIAIPIVLSLFLKTFSIFYPRILRWSWQRELWLGFPPLNFHCLYGTPTNLWKIGVGVAARTLPWPRWCHDNHRLAAILAPSIIIVIVADYKFIGPLLGNNKEIRSLVLDPIMSTMVALTILTSLKGNVCLQLPFLQFCGRISYTWYLWQWPLIDGAGWPSTMARIGVSAEAFIIAYFSTVYVEEPILRSFRRWREA